MLKTQTMQFSRKFSKFHENTQCKKNPQSLVLLKGTFLFQERETKSESIRFLCVRYNAVLRISTPFYNGFT